MSPILTAAIIAAWLVYSLLIHLTRKRRYDVTYIVALAFLLALGYFYFFLGMTGIAFEWFSYLTLASFALWMILDNTILLFKKNVSEFDFHALEQKIEHISDASELLRLRFISTIELLREGISFREGDHMFGSDRWIELFGFENNEFSVSEFEQRMVKEDLVQYNLTLEKLSKKNPTYTIKYRIENSGRNEWIEEHGKMMIHQKKMMLVSLIKPIDIQRFPTTDIDVLNTLKTEREMREEMQQLHRKKQPYHLVLIHLTNIPVINEKYGRDFGDLMMGEYLSKLRFKFIKDNKSLFRISGIRFAMLIKEKTKFDILDRALVGAGELFTMQMKFGGVTQTVYPNIGISEAPYDGKNVDMVWKEAVDALTLTFQEHYGQSFCFYNRKKGQ